MTDSEVLLQQLITGLSNGMIIALIALGYTMVYGIVELINFAHGDLFMIGAFFALTLVTMLGITPEQVTAMQIVLLFTLVPIFCGGVNWLIDRLAYRHLRRAPRLVPLVSSIGVSFVLMNIGLWWGGTKLVGEGSAQAAASPKDFPALIPYQEVFNFGSVAVTSKDLLVILVTIPLMVLLTVVIKYSRSGNAMRAIAQDPVAARLMGVDVDFVIGRTFMLGGALAGVASVMYSLYNNTIHFQSGFRAGIDAFAAAILGGIGNLPGAVLGGIVIGLVRAMSDQYIATSWTNAVVFAVLIIVLVFRPSGLLGRRVKERV